MRRRTAPEAYTWSTEDTSHDAPRSARAPRSIGHVYAPGCRPGTIPPLRRLRGALRDDSGLSRLRPRRRRRQFSPPRHRDDGLAAARIERTERARRRWISSRRVGAPLARTGFLEPVG